MTAAEHLNVVKLSYGAARTIGREARTSMSDGKETGGILLGDYGGDGSVRVRFAGTPGPHAIRRHDFFLRDLEHTRVYAEQCYRHYGVAWVGEWHTHPVHAPIPSPRDLATYDALSTDPELDFSHDFLALIAAPSSDAGGRWVLAAWACRGWACRPLVVEQPSATDQEPPTQKAPAP
ncbi:Mov34/MPN/PAD-1 family protein [Nocardia nepalensis]|uniref:Mov34/MPN/PAD-1 family protein n=1 Tax=Nocardia nepalensis TaxID=3375448 RepID=UPI003B674A1E